MPSAAQSPSQSSSTGTAVRCVLCSLMPVEPPGERFLTRVERREPEEGGAPAARSQPSAVDDVREGEDAELHVVLCRLEGEVAVVAGGHVHAEVGRQDAAGEHRVQGEQAARGGEVVAADIAAAVRRQAELRLEYAVLHPYRTVTLLRVG